jgi:hypothetical protein
MEEKLKEIIEAHELNLVKYTQERDDRIYKMKFLKEHKFEKDYDHLFTQNTATSYMFYDYRNAIDGLRKILNAWQS